MSERLLFPQLTEGPFVHQSPVVKLCKGLLAAALDRGFERLEVLAPRAGSPIAEIRAYRGASGSRYFELPASMHQSVVRPIQGDGEDAARSTLGYGGTHPARPSAGEAHPNPRNDQSSRGWPSGHDHEPDCGGEGMNPVWAFTLVLCSAVFSDVLGAQGPVGIFANQTPVGRARGSASYDPQPQTYLIAGSGQNMWDSRDDFASSGNESAATSSSPRGRTSSARAWKSIARSAGPFAPRSIRGART